MTESWPSRALLRVPLPNRLCLPEDVVDYIPSPGSGIALRPSGSGNPAGDLAPSRLRRLELACSALDNENPM